MTGGHRELSDEEFAKSFYDLFIDNKSSISNNITPEAKPETKRCTRCCRFKLITEFYSLKKTGLTQTCEDCRYLYNLKNIRRKERIKNNMVNTDNEKMCTSCGQIKTKDNFISLFDQTETKLCLTCRNTNNSAKICEHHIRRDACLTCNEMGCFVNTYRRSLCHILCGGQYSEEYILTHLDCDRQTLRNHLQDKFTPEMNWDNYNSYWNMDHFLPLLEIVEGKYKPKEEIAKRMHYTNIRPVLISENSAKSNKNPEA